MDQKIMCGPVSGNKYSNKWNVGQSGDSLRRDCLITGWIQLFIAPFFAATILRKYEFSLYSLYVSYVFYMVTGLVLIIGVYKVNVKFVWTAVYICLCHILLHIVLAIVFLVYLNWLLEIASICGAIALFCCFLVARSYAFEKTMCGPVSGNKYSNKWNVGQSGDSLRRDCLITGLIQLFIAPIFLIAATILRKYKSYEFSLHSLYVNHVFYMVTGLVLIIGVYKVNAKFVWTAVYICLCHILLNVVLAIVFLVYLNWQLEIASISGAIALFCCFLVARSYAFEVEDGRGSPVNPA